MVDGVNDAMHGAFLGPSFSNGEIERFLKEREASYVRLSDEELFARAVDELVAEKVVGWFQGRKSSAHVRSAPAASSGTPGVPRCNR